MTQIEDHPQLAGYLHLSRGMMHGRVYARKNKNLITSKMLNGWQADIYIKQLVSADDPCEILEWINSTFVRDRDYYWRD